MNGAECIAAERVRQQGELGYSAVHDDFHTEGQLAWAAACYAAPGRIYSEAGASGFVVFANPFPSGWRDRRERDRRYPYMPGFPASAPTTGEARIDLLVRAGALIAAEIDRLLRA